MRVVLRVFRSGPLGVQNPGDCVEVDDSEALRMIEAEQAEPMREAKIERAVRKPKAERAVK